MVAGGGKDAKLAVCVPAGDFAKTANRKAKISFLTGLADTPDNRLSASAVLFLDDLTRDRRVPAAELAGVGKTISRNAQTPALAAATTPALERLEH